MPKITLKIEYDESERDSYTRDITHINKVPMDIGTADMLRMFKTFMLAMTYPVDQLATLDIKGKKIQASSEDDL